jgi:hypothetical protein
MLKGQYHEIFDHWFFHQSTLPRALIHGLKAYGLVFAEKIDYNDPAETVSAG